MKTESLSEQQVASLVFYCADKEDWNQSGNYNDKFSFLERDKLIDQVTAEDFSLTQRLLLTTYLHLYGALKSIDILSDIRLQTVRSKMGVSDEFVGMIFHGMKRLNKDVVLSGRPPIISILEPTDVTATWAADVVYRANCDGGYSLKKRLSDLTSQEYEHPLDNMALDALKGTPGLELVTKAFWKFGYEQLLCVPYLGSNIQVTKESFPQIHRIVTSVCETLNLQSPPDVYLYNGFINASTNGVNNPILCLSSGTIGLLSYDELCFVIGHEIGHIKSQHVLYHNLAQIIPTMGGIAGAATLGIGSAIATGLQVALLNWQRKSEFSADRAGLLACQNVEAATSAFMKIAGAPPKYYKTLKAADFEKQAKKFEEIEDNFGKLAKNLSVMFADHPWTVMRGHELYKWVDSGEYDKVRDRTTGGLHSGSGRRGEKASGEYGKVSDRTTGPHSESERREEKAPYCSGCDSLHGSDQLFCTECGKRFDNNVIHL